MSQTSTPPRVTFGASSHQTASQVSNLQVFVADTLCRVKVTRDELQTTSLAGNVPKTPRSQTPTRWRQTPRPDWEVLLLTCSCCCSSYEICPLCHCRREVLTWFGLSCLYKKQARLYCDEHRGRFVWMFGSTPILNVFEKNIVWIYWRLSV